MCVGVGAVVGVGGSECQLPVDMPDGKELEEAPKALPASARLTVRWLPSNIAVAICPKIPRDNGVSMVGTRAEDMRSTDERDSC